MHRLLAGLLVGGAVVVAVGCGDDGGALSTEEFLAQGNAICTEGNDEVEAAFEEAFPDDSDEPDTEAIVAVFQDTFIPSVRGQIEDLRDLDAPEELADDVDDVLDDAEATLEDLEQQLEDDPEAFLTSEEDPFADINERLDEIGLTECADEGD